MERLSECGRGETQRMKALDLFCGLGGWSDGLAMEGFKVLGVEIDSEIARLYNHPVLVEDVRNLNGKIFSNFDFIVGSPPCRDFTILNDARWKVKKNPSRGLELVKAFLRIIDEAKPRFWLMENVVGLEKHLDKSPRVHNAKITRFMKRSFWGNFPLFLIPTESGRGKTRETCGWHPLAKWKRAKIPLPVARALGKAVREALK